jgi:hypothetical protein
MYALAASAAGVGMLALAHPAEGKIIYTKANKHIGPNSTLHLDLNHDGIADFDLKNTVSAEGFFDQLSAIPDRKNAVWGHTFRGRAYASALSANVKVGPKGQFLPGAGLMALSYTSTQGQFRPASSGNGPWANVTNRFLGLKFAIEGKTHFGWARLNVRCSHVRVTATLTGYAYESIANRPILTGKVRGTDELGNSTAPELGRLAQGAGSGRVMEQR